MSDTENDESFAGAMEELTTIVAELESDALDVDHLAERVARAAELVRRCRDRIDGARFAVEEILDSLEEPTPRDQIPPPDKDA